MALKIKLHDIDAAGIKAIELPQIRVTLYRQTLERGQSKPLCRPQIKKIVMGLILSLIVMVASINIIGMLILVVMTDVERLPFYEPWGPPLLRSVPYLY